MSTLLYKLVICSAFVPTQHETCLTILLHGSYTVQLVARGEHITWEVHLLGGLKKGVSVKSSKAVPCQLTPLFGGCHVQGIKTCWREELCYFEVIATAFIASLVWKEKELNIVSLSRSSSDPLGKQSVFTMLPRALVHTRLVLSIAR